MATQIQDFRFEVPLKSCPITGGEVQDSFTSINGPLCMGGFKYSYSPSADYYFINPKPLRDSLDSFYNGHAPIRTAESFDESYRDYEAKGRRLWYARTITTEVESYLRPGQSWVDFGCGDGVLLFHNSDRFDVAGVEISTLAQAFLQAKGLTVRSTMADFPERKFDLITAIDVIEHMPDPKAFLADLAGKLNVDGAIFLRLPVTDGIRFNPKKPEKWKWVYAPYHLSMFSVSAVRELAQSLQLRCEIRTDNTMHADFVGFCDRFGLLRVCANRFVNAIVRVAYFFVRPFFKKAYTSDCVFVVLKR